MNNNEIRNKGVKDYETLIKKNLEVKDEFHDVMRSFSEKLEAQLIERKTLKSESRIKEKVMNDYSGDYGKIVDVNAASLVFEDEKKLLEAYEFFRNQENVRRIKDRWHTPDESGYRDFNITLELTNGILSEIQLHLKSIMDIKNDVGHLLYEFIRTNENKEEFKQHIERAKEISRALYEAGLNGKYEKADDSYRKNISDMIRELLKSNAKGIDELLNKISDLNKKITG